MEILYSVILYFWPALFGACLGSFINVVIYRLPKGNFLSEARSYCPACREKIKDYDLFPIFSYFLLKGRCRFCGAHISLRYPLVETACALLGVFCFWRYRADLRFIVTFCASLILLAAAIIDHDTMTIPDALVLALVPFAALSIWAFRDITLIERAVGFIAISLPMLLLALIIPDAFGGGDIKLMAVCGFLLGLKAILVAFFLALIPSGIYAMYLLLSGKSERGSHMAFGPYLCAGVILAMFFGTEVLAFYLSLLF